MADRGTSKKVTRVDGGDTSSGSGTRTFVPTEDSKSRATRFRIIAIVCWVLAIGFEAGAIYILLSRIQRFVDFGNKFVVTEIAFINAVIGIPDMGAFFIAFWASGFGDLLAVLVKREG